MRIVQLTNAKGDRRVCIVDGDLLRTVAGAKTVYGLATAALATDTPLAQMIADQVSDGHLDYDPIYNGESAWKILPVVDHPADPARLLVSGTGLTHRRSADERQSMHAKDAAPTDSIRMYEFGVAGGRPADGSVGTAPEWFYKGTGTILRGHGDPLDVPPFAEDGGEEPEIAGVYVIDPSGAPRRLGMAIGNEFSDHILEKRNYLYLASCKLRSCSVGPELVIDPDFSDVPGEVAIERGPNVVWHRSIHTGESAMCHSLANMEHHHFKYPEHRRPGDLHVHYFGADAFSFGGGVKLESGDVMRVSFAGFGRPLRNPIRVPTERDALVRVQSL